MLFTTVLSPLRRGMPRQQRPSTIQSTQRPARRNWTKSKCRTVRQQCYSSASIQHFSRVCWSSRISRWRCKRFPLTWCWHHKPFSLHRHARGIPSSGSSKYKPVMAAHPSYSSPNDSVFVFRGRRSRM